MSSTLSFFDHLRIRGYVEGFHALPIKPYKTLSPKGIQVYADAIADGHFARQEAR